MTCLSFSRSSKHPKNQPVSVHAVPAGRSRRTGLMVAAYRILDQGWTNDEALAEIPNFHFNSIHTGIHGSLLKGWTRCDAQETGRHGRAED